jgi:predicted NAD/FAD-dependent oxidoreductase
VLHATPAWSEAHLEAARAAVSAALLDALGRLSAAPLPGIRHRDAHRWLYARTVAALGERCLWDGDAGLGVCGDWCLGARVELAWRSGTELASRVWSRIAPGPHAPGMHASTR